MVRENKSAWKARFFSRMATALKTYDKCFIVGVDNVRSKQMQQIRISLRGQAEVFMGKNTMIRRIIQQLADENPKVEALLSCIKGNVGFVFTHGDLSEIRDQIKKNVVAAPAKAGAIAPCDVVLPKQNTGLGPEKTNFFQALSIQTKITRGTIEILNDVPLIHLGHKVGPSEAALLGMLKIEPFSYGLQIQKVYEDGSIYDPAVLDIKPADILTKFTLGVRNLASVSLALNYPTAASVPHSLVNGFKRLLALSVETNYTFEEAKKTKEYLADPSKFAVATSTAQAAPVVAKETPKEEAKADDSSDESDDGAGMMDLFG
jgi:large subunit ribosomal protein LP0